jgi:hypothetical protein
MAAVFAAFDMPAECGVVLDDLDKDLTRRGHRFCRYADS